MTLFYQFLIPILGTFILLFIPFNSEANISAGKNLALLTSILTFIESLRLWLFFDSGEGAFQYYTYLDWVPFLNINLAFGIDGISLFFLVLTTMLIPICLLASWESIKFLVKEFFVCFLLLELCLIVVFTTLDLLVFYISFEAILIPMFFIIGIYGARQQKITAAYYFFFYTLAGSVLMLLAIFYLYSKVGSTDYLALISNQVGFEAQKWIFLAFFASLAVKIPKFPFHIWLPLAHVEAPLAGSVILAGVLIKLGAYGFIRWTLPVVPLASEYFAPLVLTLGVIAVIYASLTTIRQIDLKRIIAYSSVAHMGVVVLAIFTFTLSGIEGSIYLQLAHGVVSSALFITVTLIYDRHHTRIVKYYRGMAITMPIYAILFLVFTLANIAVPLSCNFVGEFISLVAVYQVNTVICVLACAGVILSAAYALFLYNRVCFGSVSKYVEGTLENRDVTRREFFVLLPLAILTVFLGVYPEFILEPMHLSVVNLLNN